MRKFFTAHLFQHTENLTERFRGCFYTLRDSIVKKLDIVGVINIKYGGINVGVKTSNLKA